MRHDEKPPGLTLAEALGIDVPEDAPGGAKLFPSAGSTSTTRRAHMGTDLEYEGFADVDGYGRANG